MPELVTVDLMVMFENVNIEQMSMREMTMHSSTGELFSGKKLFFNGDSAARSIMDLTDTRRECSTPEWRFGVFSDTDTLSRVGNG